MKPSKFFVCLLVGASLLAASCGSLTEGAPAESSQAPPRDEATAPTTGMATEETSTAPEKTAGSAGKQRTTETGVAKDEPRPEGRRGERVVEVGIRGLQYLPGPVTVSPGTTVRWVNEDRALHTVTSEGPGGPLESEELEKGDSYEYTFREAGRYDYYCAVHPFMKSGVTVE